MTPALVAVTYNRFLYLIYFNYNYTMIVLCIFLLTQMNLLATAVETRTFVAANDHLMIFAHNDVEYFTFILSDDKIGSHTKYQCVLNYSYFNHLKEVADVAIGVEQNQSHLVFAYSTKIQQGKNPSWSLMIVYLQKNNATDQCVQIEKIFNVTLHDTGDRHGVVIAMDPYGTRVYAISGVVVYLFDIVSTALSVYPISAGPGIPWQAFYNKDLLVTVDHRLLLLGLSNEKPYLRLLEIAYANVVLLLANKQLSDSRIKYATINNHPLFDTSLSMAIHHQAEFVIIGIPSLNLVFIVSIRNHKDITIMKEHSTPMTSVGFGQSVAFISNNTYSVLVGNQTTLPWSLSQVQVSK